MKAEIKSKLDFIRGIIEKHGLTVEEDDVPENDSEMVFMKSVEFAKLKTVFDDIKTSLGRGVEVSRYTPVSGMMNELTLGFKIIE